MGSSEINFKRSCAYGIEILIMSNQREISEWIEISLLLPSRLIDALEAFLKQLIPRNLVIKKDGEEEMNLFRLRCYFPFDKKVDDIIKKLDSNLGHLESGISLEDSIDLELRRFEGETRPWEQKGHAKPLRVTENMVIKPPPTDYKAKIGEVVIEIKPSLVFGNGSHSTTTFCLRALEDLFRQRLPLKPPRGAKVLDAGTGTGILAIASVKLGASEVLAIDVDPQAVAEAKRNIDYSQLSHCVTVSCLSVENVNETFDLVLANLVPSMLLRSGDLFSQIVKPGGFLIMSGMSSNSGPILSHYERLQFKVLKTYSRGGWGAAILHS